MTEHRTPGHPNTGRANTGEPTLAKVSSWAVLFASFGLSASTWIALAVLAGFTGRLSVLGLFTFALAWLMPVAIDGYVVTALVLWTAPVPERIAAFAKKNTYVAASVGVAAQSAYHSLSVLSATHSAWRSIMAAVVGALPPAVAALAVHMRALARRESRTNIAAPITVRHMSAPTPRSAPMPSARTDLPPAVRADHPNTTNGVRPNAPSEQPNTDSPNVRPITSARRTPRSNVRANGAQVSEGRAEKLQRIKDAYTDWRTNMPSVRQCADVLGLAPSTAHEYQKALIREAQQSTEQANGPGESPPLNRDPARELVPA